MKENKRSLGRRLIENDGVQTLLASLLCVLGGLLIGFIVLLVIEPSAAWGSITAVVKNFFRYPASLRGKYLGQTIVRTVPLLMCALSVLFAYKVGMFNIGAAGQYVIGACATLYCAIALKLPWIVCLLAGAAAGALLGAVSGVLKTLCNVNVVISGIMLNWISLYFTNNLLSRGGIKRPTGPETIQLINANPDALLPTLGLDKLFGEKSAGIAIPLALVIAVLVWVVLNKTKFGYELRATGNNPNAAKYAGMRENRNIILTMAIAGGLAGLGASLFFLTGLVDWETSISSVPDMGFNGIAVAFLGGLSPLGSILSAFFIQHITSGGGGVDLRFYSSQISSLISSLIIFLCAFVGFFKLAIQNRIRKGDEKRAADKPADTGKGGESQ